MLPTLSLSLVHDSLLQSLLRRKKMEKNYHFYVICIVLKKVKPTFACDLKIVILNSDSRFRRKKETITVKDAINLKDFVILK